MSSIQPEQLQLSKSNSDTPGVRSSKEGIVWWREASYYIAGGIDICRQDIAGLLSLVGLFMLPPLLAVVIGNQPGMLAYWIATALPWITITLGNITLVLAIEDLDAGKPLQAGRLLSDSVRWLPRYLWANGITTVFFWGLFNPLSWLIGLQTKQWGWPTIAPTAILLLPFLFWHVRLVFATYAAIVDNQPGWPSVLISLKIPQGRWLMVVAAFVGSVLIEGPLVGPLYLLIQSIHNPLIAEGYTWILVMAMRPLFIATLHFIYKDYRPLWLKKQKQTEEVNIDKQEIISLL